MKHEDYIKIWEYTYTRPDGTISYCNKAAIEHMESFRSKLPKLEYYKNEECDRNT